MLAAEPRLGAADGRLVKKQPDVRSQPQSPGVGQPVAVQEEEVRLHPQAGARSQNGGRLSKGEQSRDVRKRGGPFGAGNLQHLQFRAAEDDYRRPGRIASHGNIHASHRSQLGQSVLADNPSAQLTLHLDCLRRGDVPGVKIKHSHLAIG